MTNILRRFKHLFAAYITKCISIISDYVRQRHISVVCLCACLCVCVWPRVQVTFCILKATPVWVLLWGFFFSLRWKMEMWSVICCYHHQLKSFHAACIFRCLLRAAWQTTPLAVCPVFFPLPLCVSLPTAGRPRSGIICLPFTALTCHLLSLPERTCRRERNYFG